MRDRERAAGRFETRFRNIGGEWEEARVTYAYDVGDLGGGTVSWHGAGFYVWRPSRNSTTWYWKWMGAFVAGANIRVNSECRKAQGISPPTFGEVMEVVGTVIKLGASVAPVIKDFVDKDQ